MRLAALLAACILVIPTYTTAQTTAAEGVVALFRGDAAAAVRILGPLVEAQADPDAVAAFFFALAHRSGSLDSARSCGLFMKAATPSSPLLRQAELMTKASHMNHPLMRNQCEIAATRPWGQPTWTTFTLSPAHRVRIDPNGFIVEYAGASKRTPEGWGGAGWRFLPIRLTEVDAAATGEERRYFIELFAWTPHTAGDAPDWSLAWFVYEVVGPDVIRRQSGDGRVATTTGAAPSLSFAADEVARVMLNDSGQVERVVIGPDGRRVLLPPRDLK